MLSFYRNLALARGAKRASPLTLADTALVRRGRTDNRHDAR
jgi:hypothetical protein